MGLKIRKTDSENLSEKEILGFIEDFTQNDYAEFIKYREYYKGDNVTINAKSAPKNDAPNNKIPIPYARKLVKTVVGYMFKPGFTTYEFRDVQDSVQEELKYTLRKSKDKIIISQLGRDVSNFGVAYEYFYLDDNNEVRFIKMSPLELIPIWSYDIDPKLKFMIRVIEKGKRKYITVYTDKEIIEYYIDPDKPDNLIPLEIKPNILNLIPFNIYKNTEDYQNDYYHIIPLIDSYDNLFSGSMNEFERFAYAYLLLVKMKLSKDNAKDIKNMRIFENLENKDAVSFLTKDIPTDFITWMTTELRKEIHTQSHIPDFKEDTTGKSAVSGEALDRLLYDFEFIAADKEAYFKDGLETRISMILQIWDTIHKLNLTETEDIDIKIEMKRNKPRSRKEDMELYQGYSGNGIRTTTLMTEFATFVEDPEEEYKAYKDEQDVYRESFMNNMEENQDEEEQVNNLE